MKSNGLGRVVSQPGSSGCKPQNLFYNFHHQNQSHLQQQRQHQHQQQNIGYHPHHPQQLPQHQNYAMLPCFSQHSSNGWAGIPLISTAASSNRRPRKPNASASQRPHPPSMSCNSVHMYNANRGDSHNNEYELNPMTRLAMHAQGVPLLLTNSFNRNRLNGNRQLRPLNATHSEGYTCNYKPNGPLHQKTKENCISGPIGLGGGVGGGTATETVTGGANTQNDTAVAACLPRIIKPRKRRKKDRKPIPNVNSAARIDYEPEAVSGVSRREHSNFIEHHQHQPNNLSQMHGFLGSESQCNLKKNDQTFTDAQDAATGSICFCRECDPVSRIWAFPLRRSHSDNSSDTTEFEKATKNVGVIGSNRSSQMNTKKSTLAGSLSDSSDSGYGDILSGIQIGDDFFRNDSYMQLHKSPTDLLLSPTAESLLTESINEISRKLMETCDIKGASTPGGGSSSPSSSSSSDVCSVFSDSGLSSATSRNNHPSGDELIFNFENLSINSLDRSGLLFPNITTTTTNTTSTTHDSIFDCFIASDINNNTISAPMDGGLSPRIDPQLFNCLDMLWGTHTQPALASSSSLLIDESNKQTITPSSSSSSASFFRPTVASM